MSSHPSLLIFNYLYLMVSVLMEWWDGGLSLLPSVAMLRFKANFSHVHSDARKLALERKTEEDSVSSIKILWPKAVFRIGLKSIAMQVLGKMWHSSGMTACAFHKSIIAFELAGVNLIIPGRNMGGTESEVCLPPRGEQWKKYNQRELGCEGRIPDSALLLWAE